MKLEPTLAAPKVIVVTPWYGGNEGGVAVVTESQVQSLVNDGIPCAVIVMAPDGWVPQFTIGQSGEQIASFCVRDRAVASVRTKVSARIREQVAMRVVRKLLPENRRNCVMHLHYSMPEYSFFTELCTRWEIPMVTTFHGSDLTVNLADARTLEVTRQLVNQSKVVTAVSEALRQTILDRFPEVEKHAVVVHNAVPPDFAAAATADITQPRRDIDVLYVGNLIPRKGVDILLRAWKDVIATLETARLTIAGGGEDASMLAALARELGIDHTVNFLGRQKRQDLPGLYRRANVLVVPSRAEPLGVVVLEGLLSGAAVVGTDIGGIPEIITNGEHGILVPPENAAMLANGILTMLADAPLRNAMANAGRKRVLQHFSAHGIARQYRAVYERALGVSSGG